MSSNHSVKEVDRPAPEKAGSVFSVVLATVAVFLLAAATRLAYLSGAPFFDELYHVLAARGLGEYGEPRILEGVYNRALEYTWIIAGVFSVFGESLETARITSVFFGSALVAALFAWVRHLTGWVGGSVAAALAIFWPTGIEWSQMVRFYAPLGFMAFLGYIALYSALCEARRIWAKTLLAILAAAFLFFALRLQVVMVIAFVGLGTWFVLFVALPVIWAQERRNLIVLLILVAGGATAVVMWQLGIMESLLTRFRWTPEWAEYARDYQMFYYHSLDYEFPLIWPWMPFAAIIAIARYPKAGLFCTVTFGTSLLLHSLAGMKHERYIYHIIPLMFAIYGMAAAVVLPAIAAHILNASRSTLKAINERWSSQVMAWALIAVAVAFTSSFQSPRLWPALSGSINRPSWPEFAQTVEPWIDRSSVVATNRELHAIYYFGRADLIVSSSRLSELRKSSEFSKDNRTGIPVVGTIASLTDVVACTPSGLYINDERDRFSVPISNLVETLGSGTTVTPIDFEADWQVLRAIHWETARIDAERCKEITDALAQQPA